MVLFSKPAANIDVISSMVRLPSTPVIRGFSPFSMVVFSAEKFYSDHTEPMSNRVEAGWYDRERLENEIFPFLLVKWRKDGSIGNMVEGFTWNKPCRRELQMEYYVRDERIRMFTDEPMTYECLLNCRNVYICDEPLYMYNQTNVNSILTTGKKNYLTKSFYYLVAYMQERMKGYSPCVDRQLNEYPAHLIARTAKHELQVESSFMQAVRNVKSGLKESGLLKLIRLKGLPRNMWVLVFHLKLHMTVLAMMYLSIKLRREPSKYMGGGEMVVHEN